MFLYSLKIIFSSQLQYQVSKKYPGTPQPHLPNCLASTAAHEIEAHPIPFSPGKWNWEEWGIPFICQSGIFVYCMESTVMAQ